MQCPICGASNDPNAKFCFQCGSALKPEQPATGQTVSLGTQGAAIYDTSSRGSRAEPPPASEWMQGAPAPTGASMPYTTGDLEAVRTNTFAVAAMVLSILSFLVLPFVGSLAGIILGYQARKQIRESQGRETGESYATAGIIIGWVHMALFGLLVLFACIVFGGLFGSVAHTLQNAPR